MTPKTGLGSIPMRCGYCPTGVLTETTLRSEGRLTFRYRNTLVPLPSGTKIMMCRVCKKTHVNNDEITRIEPELKEAYRGVLKERVKNAIDTLMRHTSQRKLEVLIGLSQGYLSRLRSGTGNPSPELVSHLALLAADPEKRLAELEEYWNKAPTELTSKDSHPSLRE